MEKLFLIIIVLYGLFVGIYLLRPIVSKNRKKSMIGDGGSPGETGQLKANIVGKSRFDLGASTPKAAISTPLAATSAESEKAQDNPGTFAPPNEEKPPAEVPLEELDEAFSDTPPEEGNLPMDIDYMLEYETEKRNEDEPDNGEEEEETEEVEGMAAAALASGVQFEDLGNVIRTVNGADKATREQRQKAGNTLLEMRQTDMFEQIVTGKPDARKIVTDLISETLTAFHRKKDKEAGNTGSGRKAPESFNIKDFA